MWSMMSWYSPRGSYRPMRARTSTFWPSLAVNVHEHIALAEHAAAHLRGGVLEGEIPVAGAGPGEIGDLRLQP